MPAVPEFGVVVVWPHHVGIITAETPDGQWISFIAAMMGRRQALHKSPLACSRDCVQARGSQQRPPQIPAPRSRARSEGIHLSGCWRVS